MSTKRTQAVLVLSLLSVALVGLCTLALTSSRDSKGLHVDSSTTPASQDDRETDDVSQAALNDERNSESQASTRHVIVSGSPRVRVKSTQGEPIEAARVVAVAHDGRSRELVTNMDGLAKVLPTDEVLLIQKEGFLSRYASPRALQADEELTVWIDKPSSFSVEIHGDASQLDHRLYLLPLGPDVERSSTGRHARTRLLEQSKLAVLGELHELMQSVLAREDLEGEDLSNVVSLARSAQNLNLEDGASTYFSLGGRPSSLSKVTDRSGAASWTDLPSMMQYRWGLDEASVKTIEPPNIDVDRDSIVVLAGFSGPFRLPPDTQSDFFAEVWKPASISGFLGDWNAESAGLARVEIFGQGNRQLSASSSAEVWRRLWSESPDSTGFFEFDPVSPGEYLIRAYWTLADSAEASDTRRVSLLPGESQDLGLLMGAGECRLSLRISFVDSNDEILSPESVLKSPNEFELWVRVFSEGDVSIDRDLTRGIGVSALREAQLSGLAPGHYTVEPSTRGLEAALKDGWRYARPSRITSIPVVGDSNEVQVRVKLSHTKLLELTVSPGSAHSLFSEFSSYKSTCHFHTSASSEGIRIDLHKQGDRLLARGLAPQVEGLLLARFWNVNHPQESYWAARHVTHDTWPSIQDEVPLRLGAAIDGQASSSTGRRLYAIKAQVKLRAFDPSWPSDSMAEFISPVSEAGSFYVPALPASAQVLLGRSGTLATLPEQGASVQVKVHY